MHIEYPAGHGHRLFWAEARIAYWLALHGQPQMFARDRVPSWDWTWGPA